SVNLYLLGVLDRFERGTYSGVKVDFDKEGLYYDESHGPNWFEYYFRPVDVSDNNCPDAPVTTFTLQEYGDHSCYGESVYGYEQSGVTPERASYLIHKYFVVKPEIQATIDQFAKTHFSSSDHIIGVHYRGTDKTCNTDACEARRVTYEEMVSNIRKHIEKLSPTDQNRTKLFVASDEEGFIQYIKNHLSYPIVPSPSKKSIDGKPLHFNAQSPYQSGKEALQDCWWLGTLSQTLIRTSSNLGKMASLFYPEREVIEISKRNYQDKPS
ncbi:MAG: hypothetical protein KGQ49_02815, partial [Verrucomicrobia bacterium]|nr:hypothetical protein [Verrucomicrobiota bacterium]